MNIKQRVRDWLGVVLEARFEAQEKEMQFLQQQIYEVADGSIAKIRGETEQIYHDELLRLLNRQERFEDRVDRRVDAVEAMVRRARAKTKAGSAKKKTAKK